MPKKPKTIQPDVNDLRRSIGALTGREPASTDARYLRARLESLRERKKSGEHIKRRSDGPSVVFSISMSGDGTEALDRIVAREGSSRSDLIRQAIASWAKSHGYPHEAAAMENK